MTLRLRTVLLAATVASFATAAGAQEKLKIGVMATLSGPRRGARPAAARRLPARRQASRRQARRARDRGDRRTTTSSSPTSRSARSRRCVERDKVDFVVGADLLQHPAGDRQAGDRCADAFLISPNAGPSPLRRQGLQALNLFVTSYQNDQNHEVLGKYAQDTGFKKVVHAWRRTIRPARTRSAGFKRHFKGEVVDEVYMPLNQLDFSAELAKIAAAKPDAFFVFMPGGMGVNFVKQYRQAGLADKIAVPLGLHGRRDRPCRRSRTRRSASSAARTGRRTSTTRRTRSSSPTSRRTTTTCRALRARRPMTPRC